SSLFNTTAPTEHYTLSLHDALPIYTNRRAAIADYPRRPPIASPSTKRAIPARQNTVRIHQKPPDQIAALKETRQKQFLERPANRSEEHTSELQSRENLVCRLLLEKK